MQSNAPDQNVIPTTAESLAEYRDLLSQSNINDIENIIGDLGNLLIQKKTAIYKDLLDQITQLIKANGFSNIYAFLDLVAEMDLITPPQDRKVKHVQARYVDPENPENTWAGRGKKPIWLKTAEENGASLADFDTQPSENQDQQIAKRSAAKIRYIDPENAENTWTGRGKQPHWVTDALERGLTLADIEVKETTEAPKDPETTNTEN